MRDFIYSLFVMFYNWWFPREPSSRVVNAVKEVVRGDQTLTPAELPVPVQARLKKVDLRYIQGAIGLLLYEHKLWIEDGRVRPNFGLDDRDCHMSAVRLRCYANLVPAR